MVNYYLYESGYIGTEYERQSDINDYLVPEYFHNTLWRDPDTEIETTEDGKISKMYNSMTGVVCYYNDETQEPITVYMPAGTFSANDTTQEIGKSKLSKIVNETNIITLDKEDKLTAAVAMYRNYDVVFYAKQDIIILAVFELN